MEANRRHFTCVAIYSSKIGFDDIIIQKHEIQTFANLNGLKIESYIDAAKFDSLSLDQVSERMNKVRQSAVLVWRLDCLPISLSSMEELILLISSLARANISFMSVRDSLDTDSTATVLIESIFKAWKELKRNRKITNARASSIKAKSKNIKYKTGRKKLRDDVLIRSLRNSGLSIRKIAIKVGFSTTAVQRALKIPQQTIPQKISLLDSSLDQ